MDGGDAPRGVSTVDGYGRPAGARKRLDRAFFQRSTLEVACDLVGRLLVREETTATTTVVRLVEVEAYRQDDPASHAYRGRTAANAVMFGRAGHLYVYFTYGMHHCMNISTETAEIGSAVLLRAAVILVGHEAVRARRGDHHRDRDLLAGPGRLTEGLGIDGGWDGVDVTAPDAPLRVEDDGWRPPSDRIRRGPRVGVRKAPDIPWRFWLDGAGEVSRYTRHPGADR